MSLKTARVNQEAHVAPITTIFVVLAALLLAFGIIVGTAWLFVGAAVALLLGVIGGVTSAG